MSLERLSHLSDQFKGFNIRLVLLEDEEHFKKGCQKGWSNTKELGVSDPSAHYEPPGGVAQNS